MKNVFITGGTGFIGRALTQYFLDQGFKVKATGTSPLNEARSQSNYTYIQADTTRHGEWQNHISESDIIINLAGRTIFKFWTQRYKKQIYDSRILTTKNLVESIPNGSNTILCSASAAGYYGNGGEKELTEAGEPGTDFLSRVCIDWENTAIKAIEKGARVAIFRLGVVLGKNGGAISTMLPMFKWFMGGPLGNGMHWFPWIHIDDVCSGLHFIIADAQKSGPFVFCSPGSIRHKDFAKQLGSALHRPAFLSVPAFIIRIFMGELGRALLNSQKASPEKLTNYGYRFLYPEIGEAIKTVI